MILQVPFCHNTLVRLFVWFQADFPPLLTEEIPVISGRCCYKSLMQDGAYWSWHSLNFLNLILSRWCMNSDFHSVEAPLFCLEKQELRIEKTTATLHHRFFGLERNGQILHEMGNICLAFSFMWPFFSRTSCRYSIHSARECWFRWLWSDLVAIAQGPSARKKTDFWLVRSCLREWGNEFVIISMYLDLPTGAKWFLKGVNPPSLRV